MENNFFYREDVISKTEKQDNSYELQNYLIRIQNIALSLKEILENNNMKITFAESCSGGLIAAMLVQIPGASKVFDRGFITYSDKAKSEMLDINPDLIREKSAVSYEVAKEMALGAAKIAKSDVAVAVTGYAGGEMENYVDSRTVFIALAYKGEVHCLPYEFIGLRSEVIWGIVEKSLEKALAIISEHLNIIN